MGKQVHARSERLRPSMPLALALWHIATLAQYLKRDNQMRRKQMVVRLHFPKPAGGRLQRDGHPPHVFS
jgi:hypothetical protein